MSSNDPSTAATLPELLAWRIAQTPDGAAYLWSEGGDWTHATWGAFGARVATMRTALAASGAAAQGDRLAILMANGIEHVAMDQAAMSLGLVVVPMHAVDNPESIVYILEDSAATVLVVETLERWRAIAGAGGTLSHLKLILVADAEPADIAGEGEPRLAQLAAWRARLGHGTPAPAARVAAGDLSAIVYTSGTTGRPKGVMLTHGNVMANVKAIAARLPADQTDVFLSFLPLSHTFERTAGYYYPIARGAAVAFARSTKDLPEDLKRVRPTILTSVPRVYERFHAAIMKDVASSRLKQWLLNTTVAVGMRRFEARQGRAGPPPLLDAVLWPVLDRLVAARIRAQLGGRMRVGVSGGAPIAPAVIGLFLALGLDIVQGYGMTETSPVVSTNTPDDNDPATVGRALDGVEVRIGENSELMVRGPSVMRGYWKRPEETRRVLTGDGWLHTGDQALIRDGRITITGRIKDIIVTSTGEKVPPGDMELAILADPLFEQAMIVGEQRPFLSVLAVMQKQGLAQLEKEHGREALAGVLLRRVTQTLAAFPAYAMPRAIWWTTEPWTIENGLLTPTLKIKRLNLETRFAKEIAAMYAKGARAV
ncbi:MAG: long-chain fatty acid--CoA ligase [Hyphomicrobiaceae bacterium]|nr:long-chain fatty acid--CoA ligase [Hyphomicrobiaceae bacterium]